MSSGSFKNVIYRMWVEIIYLIYMYKKDWAFDNLQWLICHKTKSNEANKEDRETDDWDLDRIR